MVTVGGQEAEEGMRTDPVGEMVVHGSDVDVDRLRRAEVPLDSREVLVGRDDPGCIELALLDRRAQHVDAVERGLFCDRVLGA